MFKGFNIKYPEYEVITPQTGLSFTVRSLNVSEEESLKGSLLTPQKITNHLNSCIYDSIEKKPVHIKDYKSFLQKTTLKDRDALLYGLYHISYEDIRNYDITCSSCRKEYPVTVKASETFNYTPYPSKDILTRLVKVPLPMSPGVSAYIRQPTLFDESESIKFLGSRPNTTTETITEILIIQKFTQDVDTEKQAAEYTDQNDILDAYRTLPAKDKRAIHEKYQDEFGKYGILLKMRTFCTHCGHDETVDIDLVSQFFRMVYSS